MSTHLKFNEEQVRALISSLKTISEKNSGSISIKSLNEASEIIAYICGFDSWKQLRNSLRKNKDENESYFSKEHPKHINITHLFEAAHRSLKLEIPVTIENIAQLDKDLKLPKSKFNYDYPETVKDIDQMATGYVIAGSMFDSQLKYEKIYHLNPQNTLCVSSSPVFFDNICQQIYKKGKHIIEFSHVHHDFAESLNHPFVKLDPLNEVYISDYFEQLFSLDFEDSNGFDFLWALLVKNHCQTNNFIINTNILKKFLSLEFLSLYSLYLKKSKHALASLLDKYLQGLNIKREDKNIIFSQNDHIQHLFNVEKIYLSVLHLDELYQNGTFSYQSNQLMHQFIDRKSVCVQTPQNPSDFTAYIYDITLNFCASTYDKICENKNYTNNEFNTLIINSNPKLFNYPNLYTKNYSYHFRLNNHFESNLYLFQQIVFSKLDSLDSPNKDWLMKFILCTPDAYNIFALNNQDLRGLDDNTAFLWKTNDTHPTLAQDVFEINQINIYNPEAKLQKINKQKESKN